jgi:mannose-6-phosphate isomerase-like protein (cupin superfamily)
MYKVVEKYWGREDWIQVTDNYILKILNIFKGKTLLNHYHNIKEETFYIMEGTGEAIINGEKRMITKGDYIHIPPKTKHQLTAYDNLVIIEASTPHQEDSIREAL